MAEYKMNEATGPIPRSTIRAVLRVAALLASVLVLFPICATIIAVAGIGGTRMRFRVVMVLTPVFCGTMAACMGLRVKVRGRRDPNAMIFVGNHVSYLDILVGGVGVAGVFVSRHDVKDWPVIGIFARLAGTVFLDRSSLRSAIVSSAGIVERARQGIRIALFPEGGTTPGDGVGEFKPFLLGAITESRFPVQPFTIHYTHIGNVPIDSSNKALVYWYDPAPAFDAHGWQVLKLRSVRATITFHETAIPPATADKHSVRAFAEELHDCVEAGLGGIDEG
jgi:1-acyl-sn-glycerol-3-phosphate acyltransferase